MLKKIIVCLVLFLIIFQTSAFAVIETHGDVVFRDALYGAAIGAMVGGAFYLADQDDFAAKLGIGVLLGTIGGLAFGVMETRSVVEIEKGDVKFALPMPVIEKKGDATVYSTSLLKFNLD